MDSNKKDEPIIVNPLPRWVRRAFKLKDEKKMEKVLKRAREQGYSLEDILVGYHEHRLKGTGQAN